MKKHLLFFSVLALALISCTKSKEVPSPSVQFNLGTLTKGYLIKFVPFENQKAIEYNQLDTLNYFCIVITEVHVDSTYFLGTQRKPVFEVDIATNGDRENFLTWHNCRMGGWGGGGSVGSHDCEISGQIELPIKISSHIVPYNDTIEIANGNDNIRVSYVSSYTKLSKQDSLRVIKN
jgi:hypothetical protein